MSHEISVVNGKASMAYVGDEPWHGLGQKLTPEADIETWIMEAGLSYEILAAPVEYVFDGVRQQMSDRVALHRSDTGEGLHVVSTKYKVTQPVEAIEFFRDLADERGFKLETAGSLFNGRQYWALARTPHEFTLPGDDKVRAHLLMYSGCDGTANTAAYVHTRVVCNNTLRAAIGERGNLVVRRSHRAVWDHAEVKRELGLLKDEWKVFADQARTLAERKLKDQESLEVLARVFGTADRPADERYTLPTIKAVHDLYAGAGIGMSLKAAHGTAWGLLNAVTEYVDHHKGADQSARLQNAWFREAGVNLKARAMEECLKLAA